jgi:hypothetical protein
MSAPVTMYDYPCQRKFVLFREAQIVIEKCKSGPAAQTTPGREYSVEAAVADVAPDKTVPQVVLAQNSRALAATAGGYRANEADHGVGLASKVCLLAIDVRLQSIVASKLILAWSPEQISG